ncbi:hypothetical protein MKQ68_14910 [Chitinophaga horti]|uniref:Histone H1 n=1 Tax=Chitinophaga horti TaxID=2920382 RepID=A0ABY6IZQ3_9BACT|nr:hypothetical protein [Chitinophaga horti]UYQ91382.1 hypothetical protein MKQ68_14910 [Chitinophaga horti]
MTDTSYKRLKAALVQQRRDVTASKKAASRFIDDLGLRDIMVAPKSPEKSSTGKSAASKSTAKKAAGK